VVTHRRGAAPSLSPIRNSASVASPSRQAQNSSAQAAANCGPLRLSGSSAEKACATAPFGNTTRRRPASYTGRPPAAGSAQRPRLITPDGPSTITSRTSCNVGPTSASRPPGPSASARSASQLAPASVFPAPRPPRNSQVDQSPTGPLCASRRTTGTPPSPSPSGEGGRAATGWEGPGDPPCSPSRRAARAACVIRTKSSVRPSAAARRPTSSARRADPSGSSGSKANPHAASDGGAGTIGGACTQRYTASGRSFLR